MDLYLAICEDRHCDSHIRVFDTEEKAIEYAKDFAVTNARFCSDIEEGLTQPMINSGWLYFASYSPESDHVRVEKTVLNKED